jgi:hypothetical protein
LVEQSLAMSAQPAGKGVRVADLLESVVAEIEARRAKLKPVIAEYERLQAAAAALDGADRPGSQPNARATPSGTAGLRPPSS